MTSQTAAAELARRLAAPSLDLAILAEGNTSCRADDESFWVKASGFSLCNIDESGFTRVRYAPILAALDSAEAEDSNIRETLRSACGDQGSPMPSVETFMHAYLLTLPDVNFVGHTHPTSLLGLLSLEDAHQFAEKRIFPDEVVCCGPASAFVPYIDPGLPLAKAIRTAVQSHVQRFGELPKTIWMANHGLIAIGKSPAEVESASLMSAKAARVWLAALSTGHPIKILTPEDIKRIHTRPDEHYRQQLLWEMRAKPIQ